MVLLLHIRTWMDFNRISLDEELIWKFRWYFTLLYLYAILKTLLLWSWRTDSVQFIHPVVSDSLQPQGLQHARPHCPSPTPSDYSNSCPSSQQCYPIISSFVIPFSSRLQSLPASGSFQMSLFLASGGQSLWGSVNFPICYSFVSQITFKFIDLFLCLHDTIEFIQWDFLFHIFSLLKFPLDSFLYFYFSAESYFSIYLQCVYLEFMEHSYKTW